jgi:hypothetical protein
LITSSSKKVFEKIFWANETKTIISIKEKMIWTFFNLIKNFFSFISFFSMSMMRSLFEVLFRDDNDTIFSTSFIFLIFLIVLTFFLSKAKRERYFISFESFFVFRMSFDEIFVMTRFWISFFFFIVTFFYLLDRKIFEINNFFFFFIFLFRMRFINLWCLTNFLNILNFDRIVAKMTSTLI